MFSIGGYRFERDYRTHRYNTRRKKYSCHFFDKTISVSRSSWFLHGRVYIMGESPFYQWGY